MPSEFQVLSQAELHDWHRRAALAAARGEPTMVDAAEWTELAERFHCTDPTTLTIFGWPIQVVN